VIRTDAIEDPAGWGLLIADIIRHVTNTYGKGDEEASKRAYDRIIDGMRMEIAFPTDQPTGKLEPWTDLELARAPKEERSP
jgi:uncharacterized protein DUF5076